MNFKLDPLNRLEVEGEAVSLRGAVPLLNGRDLDGWQASVSRKGGGFTVRYQAPGQPERVFGLEAHPGGVGGDPAWLRYWVEGLAESEALDSFGLRFSTIENARAYLRQGYHSWDGSYYVEAEAVQPDPRGLVVPAERRDPWGLMGYAMTQILPRHGQGNLALGFDRHDRFQQTFTFLHRRPLELSVETLWDRKERRGQARCESERLLFSEHLDVEGGLRAWAGQVAAASPAPPRLEGPPVTGWCSWYNLYAYITEENVLEHLRSTAKAARLGGLPMRVFQIDDGFTPEMGDWLEVKPQFPRGMKALLEDIGAAGFVPGLWIAPFMVGNRSRLYREHPDWVVRERESGGPLVQATFYGEFRWHKRSEEYYILDTTHPQAFAYLRSVFRTWRREWGCKYFKTDFMFYGGEHGPRRAVFHRPGMTRIEIWRRTAEMIREEIGEAIWLGCGCPLWAAVGLVDGMRIGRDVGVRWQGRLSAPSRLRDQATRNFANRILWQSDPDAILLRERFHHLTEGEARALALYAGMTGGMMMTSDDLEALSPERLRLWKFLLGSTGGGCRFPFLGNSTAAYEHPAEEGDLSPAACPPAGADPVLVQVRPGGPGEDLDAVFCFNVSDLPVQRTYPLTTLDLTGPKYVFEWGGAEAQAGPVQALRMRLPPHEGRLFFLSPEPLAGAPERLPGGQKMGHG